MKRHAAAGSDHAQDGLLGKVEVLEMGYSESETEREGNALIEALPRPRVRLDSMLRLRREMARIYVEARDGRRPVSDAARLAYMLSLIGRAIEGSETERRLAALEEYIGGRA